MITNMRLFSLFALCALFPVVLLAQEDTATQITAAVLPVPAEYQEGATVLGYAADGSLTTLREGTNEMTCVADDPNRENYHVACYHSDLEPFMTRGRELRAAGSDRAAVDATRQAEIESGQLAMPMRPTALYSLTGSAYDAASNTITEARPLRVIYIPYATEASTGLSPNPAPGEPWIMFPGKPWAHIMIQPKQ